MQGIDEVQVQRLADDTAARQRALALASFIVEAPAGAGKTSLSFVNNNASGENGRFVMSGGKFEAVGAVPVGMSEISLE